MELANVPRLSSWIGLNLIRVYKDLSRCNDKHKLALGDAINCDGASIEYELQYYIIAICGRSDEVCTLLGSLLMKLI